MDKTLRIKLYGEGFKIHKLKIDQTYLHDFNNTAKLLKSPLHEAILHVDFFNLLNIKNYQTLNDVILGSYSGLINNYKSQVEIKWNRKKITKFNADELFRQHTLIPLYKTNKIIINAYNLYSGIYLIEKEIGLIATYESVINDFNFQMLTFHISKTIIMNEKYELLNSVFLNNKKMTNTKSDTLLTYQHTITP